MFKVDNGYYLIPTAEVPLTNIHANEILAKVALVVFARNADGNAFWQRLGFTSRDDLTYRNKALAELTRIDT